MLIKKKWFETVFFSTFPLTFPALLTSYAKENPQKKKSSKHNLLQRELALYDLNMHSLQLIATASLYGKLFAYAFTAHGHFVIEMRDHNLSQLSANRLLGPLRW